MVRIVLLVVIVGLCFSGFIYAQQVPKDGPYQEYYADGTTIKIEGFYKDGKKHGLFKEYDERGVLLKETSFKQDRRDGVERLYSEDNGSLLSEWQYKDGEHVGIAKQYNPQGRVVGEWDYTRLKSDNITVYKIFHGNGSPASIDTFKDGLLINKKYYNEKGETVFESKY